MTYQEIVENIKSIVQSHLFLNEFSYGDISDIKAKPELNQSPDYPYLFLNPLVHSRQGNVIVYRFNMIIMEMSNGDDYIEKQSNCQQYGDDVVARFNKINKNVQINEQTIQYLPFKERFQDTLAGMTLTIEIRVAKPINKCLVPYSSKPDGIVSMKSYKDIINNFRQLTINHLFLNEFSYGDISDIKVKNELNDSTDYPYLFLNPLVHSRQGNIIVYRFNMIIMELCGEDRYLANQSNCQKYGDDIIEVFNKINRTVKINKDTIQYSPFKERFQDTVAGMTITIEIRVAKPLNDCIIPYDLVKIPIADINWEDADFIWNEADEFWNIIE